jgi:VWFA-related protein
VRRGAPTVRFRTWIPVFAIALILGGFVAAPAQDQAEQREAVGGLTFLEEVEVTVVNIEVHVRDKDGRPVPDLTIDDFEVLQDGQIRNLTNFLYIDESFRPTTKELALAPPTPIQARSPVVEQAAGKVEPAQPAIKPIHLVVYIDNENLRPFDRNRVLGHVRRFLADTVRPGVEAMIVSYQGSMDVVTPFTSDPQELANGLRELRTRTGGRVNRDSEHAALVRDIDRMRREEMNQTGDDPLSQRSSFVYEDLIGYAERVAAETVRDLAAINRVSATLTGLPGRKALIYVSSGLPMVPAKDLFFEFAKQYKVINVNSLAARFNHRPDYRSLSATAASQGVTFYTIDAQGLAPDSNISAERGVVGDPSAAVMAKINYEEPLFYLAERTGGLATVGTNDFAGGLEKVRDDLFTYYSLGYPITAAGGDRVHRIEVRLPNHPGLKLRYRKTYVERSRESQVQDAVIAALLFDIDDNPMGIETTVGVVKPSMEGRWLLPLRISFPTEAIALLPVNENLAGEVVVYVSVRDERGKQADVQRREQAIHLPRSDYERLAKLKLSVDVQLLVEEGRYRIAVGLMDRLTRQASYEVLSASTPSN